MLTVKFYLNFIKKERSTNLPGSIGAIELPCNLKEPCSVYAPELTIVNATISANPTHYMYAYIAKFERYYYVTDWVYANGVMECKLRCDVLGTFRTQIGQSSQYVLRSEYLGNDQLIDSVYPMTTNLQSTSYDLPNMFTATISQGSYVVGVINSDSNAIGAVTYYMMTAAQFGAFKAALLSNSWIQSLGITDISNELLKTLYNPYQYIASCRYYPLTSSAFAGTNVTSIPFGWWSFTVSAKRLDAAHMQSTNKMAITMPTHPQTNGNRDHYLNTEPYMQTSVFVPPFGNIPFNPQYFIGRTGENLLIIEISIDYISGTGVLMLYGGHYNSSNVAIPVFFIYQTSAQIAVEIQLAGATVDLTGSVQAFGVGMATNVLSAISQAKGIGDGISKVIAGVGSGIENAASYLIPDVQTSGTNGSCVIYEISPHFTVRTLTRVQTNPEKFGRPLCQIKTLDDIPGYIQVKDPDVSWAATPDEREELKRYMEEGFYHEYG